MRNKRLMALGMAGLMTAMSVVPAWAGEVDRTEENWKAEGTAKYTFDNLADDADSVEDADYWEALDGTFEDQNDARATEVGVQQAMSYTVTIPSFISLKGEKDAVGGNKAEYYVAVEGDIAGSSTITVVPSLDSAIKAQESHADTTVADANYSDFTLTDNNGVGYFPLFEQGGVKKDLKATITLNDVDWTMETDKTTEVGVPETLKAKPTSLDETTHKGEISVANLSAGIFKNTINFNVTYTNSKSAETETETPDTP